ncbi:MAG: hypothetical protein QF733_05635 [Phycisphaerales bacterium]|jgi:hypothetical protein|nr:hypothetical protein [Phycisphaerales bacterium]
MARIFIIMAIVLGCLIGAAAIGVLLRHLLAPILSGILRVVQFIGRVVIELVADLMTACWNVIVTVLTLPILLIMLLLGRWEAAGRTMSRIGDRFRTVGRRVVGVVTRPAGVASPPRRTPKRTQKKGRRSGGAFPGWRVVGSLESGGSGAVMHIAEPAEGAPADAPDRVVIKCFDLKDGSPLGQMIRESRALDGAKRLGLVIEHDHDEQRFWYIMPFIPGSHLGETLGPLHATGHGLSPQSLLDVLGWSRDLLTTLHGYHASGFWHKDVKPENIITNESGAHLVDLGLVTPLQSAMTLTTHGTEYFRDPELVRQALRGAKVSEVDGARFDIYSAGAVLYYMVEGTFPAHGNLSHFDREHGDAVRWVVRRAMADYNQRYATAADMLADLQYLASSTDVRAVRPADLPSMTGAAVPPSPPPRPAANVPGQHGQHGQHGRPNLEVTDWWSGSYRVNDAVAGAPNLPDAFTQARQARQARLAARAAERQRRREARRARMGGFVAAVVGFAVLVTSYFLVVGVGSDWSTPDAPPVVASIPPGYGNVVLVNDHPRRLEAATAVSAALRDSGWAPTADAAIEASFRRTVPTTSLDGAELAAMAAPVLATHELTAAAIIQASADDPDGVDVVLVRGDGSERYRLPELDAEPVIQSTP